MSRRGGAVPDLEWPEDYGPTDGGEVVDAVVRLFRENCGVDILTEDIMLIFAPDPPVSQEPIDLIKRQFPDLEDLDITAFKWGRRGLAYTTISHQHFRRLIAIFLSLRSTTLSILAINRPQGGADIRARLEALIQSFISNETEQKAPTAYAGLFFDMGVLLDYTCPTKPLV